MKKTELEKVYALRMRFLYFSHKDNFAYFYIRNLSKRILNLSLQNHVVLYHAMLDQSPHSSIVSIQSDLPATHSTID